MTAIAMEICEEWQTTNRLYLRSGFVRCEPFGCYMPTPFTHFYTRSI